MGMGALLFGLIGGLCAVLGIITAAELLPALGTEFTWTFWFMLSGIMLLISIAFAAGSSGNTE